MIRTVKDLIHALGKVDGNTPIRAMCCASNRWFEVLRVKEGFEHPDNDNSIASDMLADDGTPIVYLDLC